DQIILLKDGRIAETGHFEDLMAAGQTFCQLISEYAVTHRGQDGSGSSSGADSDNAETQSQDMVGSGTGGDTAAAGTTPTSRDTRAKDAKKDAKKDKKAGIIQAENILDGGLSASIFLRYLRAITYKYATLIMLFQVLMQVCYVGTSLWLKYWIGQNEDTSPESRPSLSLFLSVFSGLTLVYVLMGIVLFWVAFGVARIRASEYLHRIFMSRIMRLPPAFFDTTPLGRIINRVSSDFASIDDRIPWKLFEAIGHAVSLVASLTVVAFTTPLFLVASPFIALIYYYVQKHYQRASQAVKRICRATQSPIFQHFQETLAGVSTIRAMNLQGRFIATSAERSDLYSNSFIALAYGIRWMEILVQMVNVVITLLASLWFVLLPQGSVNAATAGLALSFAMSNSQSLIWFARTYSDLYVHMIAVERVQEYAELRTEAPLSTAPDSETGRALEHHWPQEGRI
ncbi:Multidrug resistance-associated protein 1, partial [Mortierella sp. 14UC]